MSFDFILQYSYPIAFLGSIFYGIFSIVYGSSSVMIYNPMIIIANKNLIIFINIFIGLTGLISLFNWYRLTPIPIIGPYILPNGQSIIKKQI
jgi:hypothetical protein